MARLTDGTDDRVLRVRLTDELNALADLRTPVTRDQRMNPEHVAVLGALPGQQPQPVPVVADAPVEDDPVEVGQVSDELVVAAAERMPHDLRAPQGASLGADRVTGVRERVVEVLSLIHISEPTRRTPISYAVFCLKKK